MLVIYVNSLSASFNLLFKVFKAWIFPLTNTCNLESDRGGREKVMDKFPTLTMLGSSLSSTAQWPNSPARPEFWSYQWVIKMLIFFGACKHIQVSMVFRTCCILFSMLYMFILLYLYSWICQVYTTRLQELQEDLSVSGFQTLRE